MTTTVPDVASVDGVAAAAARVRDRIAAAGGDPEAVTLVAVTKGHGAEIARTAVEAGLTDLGESYGQELAAKAAALLDQASDSPAPRASVAARWHAIGRLQRNKVRLIAAHVALWQSVDRPALAEEIARRAPGAAVLVQVDLTGEPAKGGCPPAAVADLVRRCRDLGLAPHGLMAVGPLGPPTAARPAFAALSALADRLGLEVRSMGMSADLEVAVACGSTMVRIGRDLFGPRGRRGPVGGVAP